MMRDLLIEAPPAILWALVATPFGDLILLFLFALALLALFMPVYICLIFHQPRKMRAELERLNATLRQVAGRIQPAPPERQKLHD